MYRQIFSCYICENTAKKLLIVFRYYNFVVFVAKVYDCAVNDDFYIILSPKSESS